MSGWPAKVKQAFSRRKYISNLIKGHAMILHHGNFEHRISHVIDNLEIEHKSLGMSVFSFINHLKKNDPTVKSRKRKER